MYRVTRTFALVIACSFLIPLTASAKPDFNRPGFYAGMNAIYAWSSIGINGIKSSNIDKRGTWGLNTRAGYRVNRWFATELEYEWAREFNVDLDVSGSNPLLFDYSTHTVTVNGKFILPTWRIQPYMILGVGFQHQNWKSNVGVHDTTFAFRPGVGVDWLIGHNLVVNLELSSAMAMVGDGVRVYNGLGNPKLKNNFNLALGGGLSYRF